MSTALERLKQKIAARKEAEALIQRASHGGIEYNLRQNEFIKLATAGKSCVLIGAAGTGKTTCMKGTITSLIQAGVSQIDTTDHKYLTSGAHGIICVSFTRRAVANLRRVVSSDMKQNCITIHKLLEYRPTERIVTDPITGQTKTSRIFLPNRNQINPLPSGIQTIIIDESSMVSTELFEQILNALPYEVQFIFLGDIQQLPPVFGSAVLGFKMLEHPVVELTEVYRQALESPIIRLAHRILSGNPIPSTEFNEWKFPGQLTIHPWKKKISSDMATVTAASFFSSAYTSGAYNPDEDIILIPYNKSFGTDELNKYIASHIAKSENRVVHEVIAGFEKLYFSVGERVLFEREDAIITAIRPNGYYAGKRPQKAATTMDYWGHHPSLTGSANSDNPDDLTDIDDMLNNMSLSSSNKDEERVRRASHVVTVTLRDTGEEVSLETASELNSLLLAYSLTVHKSQGSEWRKVFLVLHQSHATMIQRELLYTGVTRAREELYIICEPESFVKGITSQRIKGNTLEEKAEFFKGKLEAAAP